MQAQDSNRVQYEIAYDVTRQQVIVYPQWRGTRPNFHVIGTYQPENPRADLTEYVKELGETISDALLRVGQPSIEPFKVMITPLDGSPEVMAKDFRGSLERVPVEDQVAVGAGTTAAQAVEEEQQNGTPEEIPSIATQHIHAMELAEENKKVQDGDTDLSNTNKSAEAGVEADREASKTAAKKTTAKKTTK